MISKASFFSKHLNCYEPRLLSTNHKAQGRFCSPRPHPSSPTLPSWPEGEWTEGFTNVSNMLVHVRPRQDKRMTSFHQCFNIPSLSSFFPCQEFWPWHIWEIIGYTPNYRPFQSSHSFTTILQGIGVCLVTPICVISTLGRLRQEENLILRLTLFMEWISDWTSLGSRQNECFLIFYFFLLSK